MSDKRHKRGRRGPLGRGEGSAGPSSATTATPSEENSDAYEDTWYRSLNAFRSMGNVFGEQDEPEQPREQDEQPDEGEAAGDARSTGEEAQGEEPSAAEPAAEVLSGPLAGPLPVEPAADEAKGPQKAAEPDHHVKGSAPRIVAHEAASPRERASSGEDTVAWRHLKGASLDERDAYVERIEKRDPDQLARLAMRHAGSLDPTDRVLAMRLAGQVGDDRCVEVAIKALKDPEPAVRRGAAGALGELRSPSAVPALGQSANDPDPEVRIHVVRALGITDDDAVLGFLFAFLSDPEKDVRQMASEVLTQWSSPAVAKRLAEVLASPELRGHATEVLVKMGEAAEELLVNVLMQGHPEAAPTVGRLLARIAGTDDFVARLSSPEPSQRLRAVEALGAIGGQKAVDALVGTLADPDERIRARALRILGKLGDDRALSAMERSASSDPVSEVVEAAREALERLRGEAAS